MPKFDDYTQKTAPEDTDIALILDKTANVNKKTPFSGIWTWIVNKMTNAVIQNLQTTNKTVIGSINELNSKIEIVNIKGTTNEYGNISATTNVKSENVYCITNIADNSSSQYFMTVSSVEKSNNLIWFRLRKISDSSLVTSTSVDFKAMIIYG